MSIIVYKRNMRLCSKVILMMILLFCCMGCNERITLLHTYHNVPKTGWNVVESIDWELPGYVNKQILATVEVCYTQKYKYANLWMECSQTTLSNQLISTDTLVLILEQNQRLGQAIGLLNIDMQCADSTNIKIRHLMPDSLLIGISAIGLRIMPIDEHDQRQFEGK